jgi:hypothetical protein
VLPDLLRSGRVWACVVVLGVLLGPGMAAFAQSLGNSQTDAAEMIGLAWDAAHGDQGSCWTLVQATLQHAGVCVVVLEEEWTGPQSVAVDVLWVSEPDAASFRDISEDELRQAARFVADGGGLVVTGGAPGRAHLANRLLAAVGATMYLVGDMWQPAAPGVRAEVAIPERGADLRPLLLPGASSVQVAAGDVTVLLEGPDGAVLGALERVGRGYVAAFGGPLLTMCHDDTSEFDNYPFVAALVGWLGERARQAKAGR